MANITIRDIPPSVLDKIRTLAVVERRSLNSELLVVIEKGTSWVESELPKIAPIVSIETQCDLWTEMCGKWQDQKTTEETIQDIQTHRTMGRDITL